MSKTTFSTPHNLFSVPDISPETTRDSLSGHGNVKVLLYPYHSPFDAHELISIASALVNSRGKGIYATDESPDAMAGVFEAAMEDGVKQQFTDEENRERRKKWREVAYSAVPSEYISGVILHAETLLDFKLAPMLSSKGIIPGVRANGELAPIPRSEEEFIVQGLDDLLPKLQAARAAGARFSKWRTPIAAALSMQGSHHTVVEIQAETLAQFAAISQQAGLVPIVEPDVDFSKDADLTRSAEVHERASAHGFFWRARSSSPHSRSLAYNTLPELLLHLGHSRGHSDCHISFSPAAVPGVLFLSGGLPSVTATQYLAAVNALVLASPPTSPFSRLPALTFPMDAGIEKWSKACWHAARGEVL
ncbi:hypothetical protein BDZ97DRAFT_1938262 [Flammula alnicola]|nr:hypothetical protein BDZ97DRAFT_1938262 [Flammula alnicola]